MKHLVISIITILTLSAITIAIIAYARGFRFNPADRELTGTGLLVAKSEPDGAQVFINGELKTATNATVNLPPGRYDVRIEKEGFQPWQKSVPVFEEVVSRTDAILFPANPGLSPLTNSGVSSPVPSPDGAAIAFARHDQEATPSSVVAQLAGPRKEPKELKSLNSGIFVLELANRPLSFSRNPRQVLSFSDLEPRTLNLELRLLWSPESNSILLYFYTEENPTEVEFAYLLDPSTLNTNPRPVPGIQQTLALWDEQRELERQNQIRSLPADLIPLATSSAEILSFSPDESKILYRAIRAAEIPQIITPPLIGVNPTQEVRAIEPDNLYVYDLKEDRNYLLPQMVDGRRSTVDTHSNLEPRTSNAATSSQLIWFPTSRHLLFIEDAKIKIMEYDTSNKTTLYAGPLYPAQEGEPDLLVPWPNGTSLVILTTLNPDAGEALNLYAVKLR